MNERPESEWKAFFNGHAPEYDENVFTKNTEAEIAFLVEKLALEPGMTVLDVGCGTGRHAIELARHGCRVTGIDISNGMLEEARRKARDAGVEVNLVEADATNFSFPEPFDAVICLCEGSFGLLGGGDDPIAQPWAILRNVSASMKPGAKCLFTVLNAYRLARLHSDEDVKAGRFDPLTLSERSEFDTAEPGASPVLRERAFVPTELVMLFDMAGLTVHHIWGGTAGNWGERPIELDEYELMVFGEKREERP